MLILTGVDDSPGSAHALRWAHHVAGATGADLHAVRSWMYPKLSALPGTASLPDATEMDALVLDALDHFVADTLGGPSGVKTAVVRGPADHALLREVTRRDPAMVVVGRRGLGTVESRLLGSVSRRLTEHATCPVVVTSEPGDITQGERRPVIMVGVDGSEHAKQALAWAADLAGPLGAEIVAAHAAGPTTSHAAASAVSGSGTAGHGNEILDEASRFLDQRQIPHRVVLTWGDPRRALEDVAEEVSADLVVVASRGIGLMAKMLVGSVASYLVQHVGRPVAIVPVGRRTV